MQTMLQLLRIDRRQVSWGAILGALIISLCITPGSLVYGQEVEQDAETQESAGEDAESAENPRADAFAERVIPLEEIVVTAQRPLRVLRFQFEELQSSFFSDYNDLNPNDQFDVFCNKPDFTHTRIQQELCLPQFFLDAMAEQTRFAFINQNFSDISNMSQLATRHRKGLDQLSSNILTIASQYPELADTLIELGRVEAAIRSKEEECEGPRFLFLRLCRR